MAVFGLTIGGVLLLAFEEPSFLGLGDTAKSYAEASLTASDKLA